MSGQEAFSRHPRVSLGPSALFIRLQALGTLKDDWNRGGSAPPNAEAVEDARQLLTLSGGVPLEFDHVKASAEGGVALLLEAADCYGFVEVLNDGHVVAGIIPAKGKATVWKVERARPARLASLEKLRARLRPDARAR